MSKQTPSQDFNFEFTVVLDEDKETDIQKIKRWISKRKPPLNIILSHLFSYFEKWYTEWKIKNTMLEVDKQVKEIGKIWDEEDERNRPKAEIVEEGLFGEEGWSISISNPVVERRSEETDGRLGDRSNEIRLGEKLPDPWLNKEDA
jgi:hypothetical protein